MKALYFIFCLLLVVAEPIMASPLHRALYSLFVIVNVVNLVRLLCKRSKITSHDNA